MKTQVLFSIIVMVALKSTAQVSISGTIANPLPGSTAEVTFVSDYIDFNETSAAKVRIDEGGKFRLCFPWEKAGPASLVIGEQSTNLFLVKGDSLTITDDYTGFDSTLHYSGRGSADNNYLAAEINEDYQKKANRYSYFTDATIYAAYEDSLEKVNWGFLKSHDNGKFTNEFKSHITISIKYRYFNPRWMFKVLYDRKTRQFSSRELPQGYFDFLKNINLNDEAAIDNTNYQVALMRYLSEFNDDKTGKELKDSLPEFARIKAIVDRNYKFRKSVLINKVRDYELTIYLKDELGGIISDSKFTDSLLADYKSVCHNPEYIAAIDKLYLRAMSVLPGNAAPEFSLRNAEGKTVSLSSYKGKTVYIDFWATWCVPCIAAMPKSKALEEKLKDHRDIVFLYIDVRDDSTRWKNYLAKEKAEGDHLFADKEQSANLYRVYNFNGIPHYALLDKNGKIVEANMDGPGDVAEKKILKAAK